MDNLNMTMEEYIKLEEENSRRRGRLFNWETTTYEKIRVDDDLHDLISVEAEFLAIVIDDAFAPQDALPCKSQVSTPVNNEIDFRISFDKSDDEDYIIIYDKNLFSYKMISFNKTDSANDNEKAGIPSFLPPKPTTSYVDDLDFFKDFENEFPVIVYNDAQTSKSDYLTEQTLSPQHYNESDLNDETSLSEHDEVGQNILYFNDLFPFNDIHPDDLKSDEDNDNKIGIIQSSEGNLNTHRMLLCFIMNLYVPFGIPFDPKRYYKDGDCAIMLRRPRYQGLEYTDVDIADFEERLERMVIEHHDDAGVVVFTTQAWGRLFDTRGPLVWELILEFLSTLRFGESKSKRMIPGKGDLHDYWRDISTDGYFLGPPPSYTLIRDSMLRICHRMMAHSIAGRSQAPEKVTMTDLFYLRGLDVGSVNVPYLLAQYLRRFAARRKSGAHISVITTELLIIDMAKLVRLQICEQLDDTWAWVAIGPERQPDAAAGAPAVTKDAPAVGEGDQAVPAPVQAPQHPPPPPPAAAKTMSQRLGRLEEEVHGLRRDVGTLRGLMERSMTDQGRFFTWMISCMAQLMDASGLTYQAFDGTFRGSSPAAFQRCTRQRTDGASTSAEQ
ncbi:hypothetical protein Tco_0820058 [Tanacetum coccineum]|uniref:Reverse transcriptase domain-containing protein n=1 Tax=Tanacetum coccineum TaxID=301880 RepID=A0ABQ5ACL6_9ASTR